MRSLLLTISLFLPIITYGQKQSQTVFKITTFTDVPKEMKGCGINLFLSKQDENAERFVFYTDYVRGLIRVNDKMILITNKSKLNDKSSSVFSNKDYTLLIKYIQRKDTGDESYEIKQAVITLKYHSKTVWTKSVIGGGGC